MRWAWIGLAIVSTVGYLWLNPLIVIVLDDGVEDEELDEKEVLVDAEPEDDAVAEAPVA